LKIFDFDIKTLSIIQNYLSINLLFLSKERRLNASAQIYIFEMTILFLKSYIYLRWEQIRKLRRKISNLSSRIQEANSIISLQASIKILRMNLTLIVVILVPSGNRKEMNSLSFKTMIKQSIAIQKQ